SNATNGQISEISIFGNTKIDEDNVKSTFGAIRLKSVGKNLFEGEISAYLQSGNFYFDGSQLYFKRIASGLYSGAITKIKTEIGKTYIVSWKYISGDISY